MARFAPHKALNLIAWYKLTFDKKSKSTQWVQGSGCRAVEGDVQLAHRRPPEGLGQQGSGLAVQGFELWVSVVFCRVRREQLEKNQDNCPKHGSWQIQNPRLIVLFMARSLESGRASQTPPTTNPPGRSKSTFVASGFPGENLEHGELRGSASGIRTLQWAYHVG